MEIGKIKFPICNFQFAISNITRDVMEAQVPFQITNWVALIASKRIEFLHVRKIIQEFIVSIRHCNSYCLCN